MADDKTTPDRTEEQPKRGGRRQQKEPDAQQREEQLREEQSEKTRQAVEEPHADKPQVDPDVEKEAQQPEVKAAAVAERRREQLESRKDSEAAQDARALLDHLEEVPREDLVRLRNVLDEFLTFRHEDPVPVQGPNLQQIALNLPRQDEHDVSIEKVAEATSVEENDVADYSVRQATNARGEPIGAQYVVVVTHSGQKKVATL